MSERENHRPSVTPAEVLAVIVEEMTAIIAEKGDSPPPLTETSVFLGGSLPVDSLDLATLLVVLEKRFGFDPFRGGFRRFTTAGELAAIYAEAS